MRANEQYSIHPAIGIGRVGNSPDSFYLAPDTTGGLPFEPDQDGNPLMVDQRPVGVTSFKDGSGRVRRQAARFQIFRSVPGQAPVAITLDDPAIARIEWTVHVANKKAAWWNYIPLLGDLMFGPYNSYQTWTDTPSAWGLSTRSWTNLRNAVATTDAERRKLIVDPGPRTLDAALQRAQFDQASAGDYPWVSFPGAVTQGLPVRTLGEMRTDSHGNLLVIGAYGRAGGNQSITGFGGGDTWNDDVADGPVGAIIHFNDGSAPVELQAWVLIGSPKFAPELVNISTWDDVVADMSIKFKGALPDAYDSLRWADTDGWNPAYVVNFEQDIRPFLERMGDYQWVATVPSMTAFIRPSFDVADASEDNRANRENFFSYFRRPSKIKLATELEPPGFSGGQDNQLFSGYTPAEPAAGIPLMPVNSGTNSVRNNIISKFSVLTDTQFFALQQWSAGKFSSTSPGLALPGIAPLDRAAISNCVGEPMCPGIEVTWSVRNPAIYERPYVIRHRALANYQKSGLSPGRDECEPLDWRDPTVGGGCEPGDLTKRMAIPWQADFYDCSVQMINFDDVNLVKNPDTLIPVAPTYYAYWWPPQSPWNVISGATSKAEQLLAGVPAGMQVMYSRGMNSFSQMISSWQYLGFVVNQNKDAQYGRQYPYFVEKERNHDKFVVASVGVGNASSFITGDDSNYLPAWFLKDEDPPAPREASSDALQGASSGAQASHHDVPKKIEPAGRRRFSH
ncbi:CTQ-dependent lysine 6-oxidase LodA [Massilia aurea]|uniref:CTQ-dependent lysine 6-oxidase LodA n=1 Tax=Massilia aurea TaxID=373040 RepID=UPI003461F879